jgi:hypothetical protein
MSEMCETRIGQLMELLYEEIEPASEAELRAHLAVCPACRAEYESLIGTRELLAAWPNAVNAPRLVYVGRPVGLLARTRRWIDEMGALGLRGLLRPALVTAAAVLVLLVAFSVVRFRVGPDGLLQVGFGTFRPTTMQTAEGGGAPELQPVSRQEFQSGLLEMLGYLQQLMENNRAQDRQIILATLDERLDRRDTGLRGSILATVQGALDELDRRRVDDLTAIAATLENVQFVTTTELQRTNAILSALVQQGLVRDEREDER